MTRFKQYIKIILPLLFAAFFATSCDTVESITKDLNLFSDQDDVSLGANVVNEIKNNPQEYPVYTKNPAVKSYIKTRIFDEVLKSDNISKKNVYNYSLEIIDNDEVLNAFALPGGPVYLYTGLIKYLDSEAALAGIIGHEIAHAEERHASERMTKQYGVSILLGMILGENPSQLAEIATNLFTGIAFLSNSRTDEEEADKRAFEYTQDTRYYPGGVKFFFEKLNADGLVSSSDSRIETFLSTHPNPIDRIADTDQRLRDAGLTVYSYSDDETGFYKAEYKANIIDQL